MGGMLRVRSDIVDKRQGQDQLGLEIEVIHYGVKKQAACLLLYCEKVLHSLLRARSDRNEKRKGLSQGGEVIGVRRFANYRKKDVSVVVHPESFIEYFAAKNDTNVNRRVQSPLGRVTRVILVQCKKMELLSFLAQSKYGLE